MTLRCSHGTSPLEALWGYLGVVGHVESTVEYLTPCRCLYAGVNKGNFPGDRVAVSDDQSVLQYKSNLRSKDKCDSMIVSCHVF